MQAIFDQHILEADPRETRGKGEFVQIIKGCGCMIGRTTALAHICTQEASDQRPDVPIKDRSWICRSRTGAPLLCDHASADQGSVG